MPFFSIVIPAYNRVNMLPRCIDSILNQSFSDFEIIVVDNYSEDGTKELMEDYQKKDVRVNFVQEHNHGIIAHSRNVGIRSAKGIYIALLDSDDWYRDDKLERTYQVITQTDADLVYHPLSVMSSKGEKGLLGKPLTWDDKYLELLIEGDKICNSSVVVKKAIIENIGYIAEDSELVGVEDYDCWLRISMEKCHLEYIQDALGYYWEGDNLSASEKQVDRIEALYQKHIPNVSANKKENVLFAMRYRQARILHGIGIFNKAVRLYISLLRSNTGGREKLKIVVLLLFSLINIKK